MKITSRLAKHLLWLPAVALALTLAGQVAMRRAEVPTVTAHASWAFHPKNFREARDRAHSIVHAQVVSVEKGDDLVLPVQGEPDGEDRIPTQRVTVRVKKVHKGSTAEGALLTLFQTGGTRLLTRDAKGQPDQSPQAQQVFLEGDPPYEAGEEYVLLLEDGPRGLLRPVSPEGRFKVEKNGTVKAMVDNEATHTVHRKPLAELEKKIKE